MGRITAGVSKEDERRETPEVGPGNTGEVTETTEADSSGVPDEG